MSDVPFLSDPVTSREAIKEIERLRDEVEHFKRALVVLRAENDRLKRRLKEKE